MTKELIERLYASDVASALTNEAARAIEALQARVADQSAQLTRHTNLIDQLQEERCKLAAELTALKAQVVRMNDALLRGVLTTLEMFGLSAIDLTAYHAKVYEIAAPIPPVREPLSDNTILGIYNKVGQEDGAPYRFAGAIEAAIKEQK